MIFLLNEFELLRATNEISQMDGGCFVGTVCGVGGSVRDGKLEVYTGRAYPRQYLVSAELRDNEAGFGRSEVPPGKHKWEIRLGFCQSHIDRAPRGGFALEIPPELLSVCPTVDHVVDLWEAMKAGKRDMASTRLHLWHQSVTAWIEQRSVYVLNMNAMVSESALAYAQDRRLIG